MTKAKAMATSIEIVDANVHQCAYGLLVRTLSAVVKLQDPQPRGRAGHLQSR